MAWNQQYWDNLDQIYWWPKYIGLSSINQRNWTKKDDLVCVPREMVNMSGPLYTRGRTSTETVEWLLGQEEILNQVFDIAFSIAPDEVIRRAFFNPLGIEDTGPFQSLGREIQERYGWDDYNITQHDGLFVSDVSAVGVELKLGSPSDAKQIAKYAAILLWEELNIGRKANLGLLYIVPEKATHKLWQKCGLAGPNIPKDFVTNDLVSSLPKTIQNVIKKHPEHYSLILERLKLGVVSWNDLRQTLEGISISLDSTALGDQTLIRLLSGFLNQLKLHRGT